MTSYHSRSGGNLEWPDVTSLFHMFVAVPELLFMTELLETRRMFCCKVIRAFNLHVSDFPIRDPR